MQPPPHPPSKQSGVAERLDNEQAATELQNAGTASSPANVAASTDLPQELAGFKEIEVIGCDAASLEEYHQAGDAFGVMPDQLVDQVCLHSLRSRLMNVKLLASSLDTKHFSSDLSRGSTPALVLWTLSGSLMKSCKHL